MNSIRISDHKGKQYLSYKYNIESGIKVAKWYKDDKGFWRYNCPNTQKEIDNLLTIIFTDKLKKKVKYKNRYNEIIERYKQQAISEKGFWEQAREVTINEFI